MPTLTELLGDKLLEHTTSNGVRHITTSELNGKVIGLYFSGHWCPPSREFTPRLVKAYKSIISEVKNQFEIVFISWDQSQQEFDGYFAEMPWKALTYSERTRQDNLTKKFNVTGIPRLVILSPTCQVITTTGVQDIYSNGIENIRKWSAKAQQIIVASTEQIEPCLSGAGQVHITQYSREWTSSSGGQQAYISGSAEQHASSSSSSSSSGGSIEQRVQHALQQASSCSGGSIERRALHSIQQASSCGDGSTEQHVQQASSIGGSSIERRTIHTIQQVSSSSGGGSSIEYGALHAQQQASSSSSGGGSIEQRAQHAIQQASSCGGGSTEQYVQQVSSCGGGSIERHAQQQASSCGGGGIIERRTLYTIEQVSGGSGGGSIERRAQHAQQQVNSSAVQQASSSGGSIIERRTQHTTQQVSSSSGGGSIERATLHAQQQVNSSAEQQASSSSGSIIERRIQHTAQQVSSSSGGGSIERDTLHAQQQVNTSAEQQASSSSGGSIIERRIQRTTQQATSISTEQNTQQETADSNEFIDTNVKTKKKTKVVIPKQTAVITKESEEEIPLVSQKEKKSKKSKSRFCILLSCMICLGLLLLALLLLFIIYKMVPRLRKGIVIPGNITVIGGKTTFTDVEDITVRAVFSTDYTWKDRTQSQIITDLDNLADQINAKLSSNKVRILKAYFTNYRLSKNYRRFICPNPLLGNILQLHLLASFIGQCEYDNYACKSISREKLKNSLIEFLNEAFNIYFDDERVVKTNIKFCTFTDNLDIEDVKEEEEEPPKEIIVMPTPRLPIPTPPPPCVITPITIDSVSIAGQDNTEIRDDGSYNHPSTAVTFHDNSINRLRLQLSCDQQNDNEFSCNRVYLVETSIDLNNDGRFDELENRIHPRSLLHSEISHGLYQFEISIPAIDGTKVHNGLHRMRVRVYPGEEFQKNCGSNDYAETREYKVNIIPKPVQIETVRVEVPARPQPYIQPAPTPPPPCVLTPIRILSAFITGQDNTEIRDDGSYYHPSTAVTFHDNSVNRLRLQLSCDQRNDGEFSCNRFYFVETSIDLNNDGRFDELENRIHPRSLLHSEISHGLYQFEISIPAIDGTKVHSGLHRMRVRVYPGKEFRKNCGSNEYAETREYKVNIIPKPVKIETVHVEVQPRPQPPVYIQPAPLVATERSFVCAPNVEQIKWILAGGELGTQIRDSSSYTNPVTKEITFFGDAVYLIRVELDCRSYSDSDCTRGHHVDIFLDLNGDGNFDRGENRVFRRTYIPEETPDNTFDLQILIPPIDESNVKTGLHRMRLTLMRSETYQKQCGRSHDSIVREYMVNIVPRKGCVEREYAIQPQSDIEEESEQEPDYVVQLSADFSSRPYCSAGNLVCSVGNTGIYSLKLSGERNTMINDEMRSCREFNNYEDRSRLMVDLFEGTTYSLRIQFHCTESDNCDSIYYLGAWIDFNNDGLFDEIGERLIENYQIDNFSFRRDNDLNIRISQLDNQNYRDGTHRMRIVLVRSENGLKPCFSSGYGEARDYTVHILPKEY